MLQDFVLFGFWDTDLQTPLGSFSNIRRLKRVSEYGESHLICNIRRLIRLSECGGNHLICNIRRLIFI